MPNEYIEYNTKICQRNPSKKEAKRALLNILETEDFYMEPDEIMLNSNTAKLNQIEAVLQYFLYT